jgi:VanZ family protein
MLKFAVRTLAWIAFLAILATTLSPIDDRPHLTTDPAVERSAAFFLLGLLFCIGYRRHWAVALGIVLVAAGGFEAAQLLTPDRHAEIADTVVKIAGGLVGFGAGLFVRI